MTFEKILDLRNRMKKHKVVKDTAIVELTAAELQEMLDFIEEAMEHGLCDAVACCINNNRHGRKTHD